MRTYASRTSSTSKGAALIFTDLKVPLYRGENDPNEDKPRYWQHPDGPSLDVGVLPLPDDKEVNCALEERYFDPQQNAQLPGAHVSQSCVIIGFPEVLVQISIFCPIWQASDAISPRTTESAHRPFLKFAPEPNFACLSALNWQIHCYGEGPFDLKALCDARGVQFHHFSWTPATHKAGLIRNAAYILRPDGYIGIVVPHADPKNISSYLETWLSHR